MSFVFITYAPDGEELARTLARGLEIHVPHLDRWRDGGHGPSFAGRTSGGCRSARRCWRSTPGAGARGARPWFGSDLEWSLNLGKPLLPVLCGMTAAGLPAKRARRAGHSPLPIRWRCRRATRGMKSRGSPTGWRRSASRGAAARIGRHRSPRSSNVIAFPRWTCGSRTPPIRLRRPPGPGVGRALQRATHRVHRRGHRRPGRLARAPEVAADRQFRHVRNGAGHCRPRGDTGTHPLVLR